MSQATRRTTATLGFSVAEFCEAHNISIGHFYALRKKGLAPRIMKVGLRTIISAEEAARRRAERTAASAEHEQSPAV